MLQKNLCFNTYDLCWRTSFLYIYITRLCRQMMFDERIIIMCHSVYTRSNFTMTLNVCTPYQSALHNLWIVLWLLMPPISEKMGNVIHPQVFTRYGKLQIIFSLPIVHLQYRLHHIDWCFFWAISVYGLRWSGKKRRKLELWRHQNKTKLQTYHREMTLVSYAKATKGFEKGLLIISIRLLIISLFVLSLCFRGNIFLV